MIVPEFTALVRIGAEAVPMLELVSRLMLLDVIMAPGKPACSVIAPVPDGVMVTLPAVLPVLTGPLIFIPRLPPMVLRLIVPPLEVILPALNAPCELTVKEPPANPLEPEKLMGDVP